jgi:hypothetical protein
MQSSPDFHVLDQNLGRLLREAYVPVETRSTFRVELQAHLEQEITALAAAPSTRAAVRKPFLNLPRLAAAAALFPIIAWFSWKLMDYVRPGHDELLAQGQVAVQEEEEAWRALTPDELEHGIRVADLHSVAVHTPRVFDHAVTQEPELAATVLSEDGQLQVRASTQVRVKANSTEDDANVLTVQLTQGTIVAQHDDEWPGHCSISMPGGALVLCQGSMLVSTELDRTAVYVYAGTARGPGDAPLPTETWLTLREGRFVPDSLPEPREDTGLTVSVADENSHRAAVEPDAPVIDEPTTLAPSDEPQAPKFSTLGGFVRSNAWDANAAQFTVVLLKEVPLPDVSHPTAFPFLADSPEDGDFVIPDVEPGTYTVYVVAEGFATWNRKGVELGVGETHELSVDLFTGVAVAGRIVDRETGRPIEGAFVLSETDAPTQILPIDLSELVREIGAVVTDHEGRFELPRLSAGKHVLRASAPGYGASWSAPIEFSGGPGSELGVAGDRVDDVTVELGPEGQVHGRVSRDDGGPWSGAFVIASLIDYTFARSCMTCATTVAGEDGSFELRGLPPGIYVVLNGSEAELGGTPRIRSTPLKEGERVRVDLGDPLSSRLVGTLTDADGEPVRGRDITLVPVVDDRTFHSTRTDADGRYELPGLPAGEYAAFYSHEMAGDMLLLGLVDVAAMPEMRQDFQLRRTRITGRVTTDGAPMKDVIVVLERTDSPNRLFAGRYTTDEDGHFDFAGVAPGEYDLSAFATVGLFGEERIEGMVLLEDQDLTGADLELFPGGALVVRVTDDADAPIKGALVRFTDERGHQVLFNLDERTNAIGEFPVAGLKPGVWTVSAKFDETSAEGRIEVHEGIESVLTLVLTP